MFVIHLSCGPALPYLGFYGLSMLCCKVGGGMSVGRVAAKQCAISDVFHHRLHLRILLYTHQVEVMQRELKELQPVLASTAEQVETMMAAIANDKEEAAATRLQVRCGLSSLAICNRSLDFGQQSDPPCPCPPRPNHPPRFKGRSARPTSRQLPPRPWQRMLRRTWTPPCPPWTQQWQASRTSAGKGRPLVLAWPFVLEGVRASQNVMDLLCSALWRL